ncbi:MAG: ElyC/SanA/YdcF family protein [Candidatus Gracilibacteria bacterium]|nr:ElyC/SanA/YdcF family protein [Candidatus Gracilibacteria bacterium]
MKKLFLFVICVGIILMLPWMLISFATTGMIYTNVDDVPARKYGLLLGTSPGAQNSNLFFNTRIEAAKILYEKGKIEYIIVSGDNSTSSYNEPLYMKTELERRGVATDKIVMDYAGFRTLDSVLRAKEIFSLTDDITIISQPFHLERALFLAKFHKINAIGFGAADVSLKYGLQTYIREIGARWLAMYDAIRGTQATVLGDKVEISENAEKNISE